MTIMVSSNCNRCGRIIVVTIQRQRQINYCEYCQPQIKAENTRRARKRMRAARLEKRDGTGGVIILSDPDRVGGFAEGVYFSAEEHEANMQHMAYTPGTIVARDGYKICIHAGTNQLYERSLGRVR